MSHLTADLTKDEKLQLEISAERLADLISQGALLPNELRCCNANSKKCLWRLLLKLTKGACD